MNLGQSVLFYRVSRNPGGGLYSSVRRNSGVDINIARQRHYARLVGGASPARAVY
jgi:hypothetical protein